MGKIKYYYLAKGTHQSNKFSWYSAIPIVQNLIHTLWDKFSPPENESKDKDQWQDNLLRVRDFERFNSKCYISNKSLLSGFREILGREDRKTVEISGDGWHQKLLSTKRSRDI